MYKNIKRNTLTGADMEISKWGSGQPGPCRGSQITKFKEYRVFPQILECPKYKVIYEGGTLGPPDLNLAFILVYCQLSSDFPRTFGKAQNRNFLKASLPR